MKVVILAGGLQSTVSDTKEGIPKPMAEIGGKPILWHIMKMFSTYGFKDFIICGGYKINMIKEYFMDYYIYQSDITIDLQSNEVTIHKKKTEDWNVTVVDTGVTSTLGERILRARQYIGEDFLVTYGDCLTDIDLERLVAFHKWNKKIATIAVAKPAGRNQMLPIDAEGNYLGQSDSANTPNNGWVNACCEVFTKEIYKELETSQDLEIMLFNSLAQKHEIISYKHKGFYSSMETKRDKAYLESLWQNASAPWKIWNLKTDGEDK